MTGLVNSLGVVEKNEYHFINETENIVAVKYRKDMVEEEAIKAKIVK